MIFIANKYSRIYYSIVNRAKSRSVTGYKKHITLYLAVWAVQIILII
jgi:hypothetical protein